MTVYAITDTKKGEQGFAYLSSNYPNFSPVCRPWQVLPGAALSPVATPLA